MFRDSYLISHASAGYPLIVHFTKHKQTTQGGFNFGGINATGQVPNLPGSRGLIDAHTPVEAHTKADYDSGNQWQLIFSDEFEVEGRTFWPGDDPYWEAVDLHYWQTGNLEWLDPTAITTRNGSLEITMSQKPRNGLNYTSGMMSTWNKFCFTGGMIEVSVSLPGMNNVAGLWPAVWTMGNLGRAGYGASLEGMVVSSCRIVLTGCDCSHAFSISGHIPMIPVTSGLLLIRPRTACLSPQRRMVIPRTATYCRICPANVCRDARAPGLRIRAPCTRTGRMWVAQHLRLISLKHRYAYPSRHSAWIDALWMIDFGYTTDRPGVAVWTVGRECCDRLTY